jgi:phosphate-selective porin OprO/OprP
MQQMFLRHRSLLGRPVGVPAGAIFLAVVAIGRADAQSSESRYDALWDRAAVYTGESDSLLRSVELSGRFQVDQAYVDSGDESHSETNLRRMRLGAKIQFRDDWLFHAEAEYDPQDGEPVYQRLTDAYVAWSPSDAVELTVGKHGAPFTMDGMTSSKELIAIDRSNLTNNIWFTEEYIPGVSVEGGVGRWRYHAGFYSSGSKNRGFGDSDGGEFMLGTVRYDLAEQLGADEAVLSLNLVDNDPDPNNGFTRPLENVTSVTFAFKSGAWSVRSDLSTAQGYLGQSDLQGVMVMPFYDLGDSVQLVARYTYLESDDANGVRFGRYENEIESGRGDEYREAYVGMNYYWYGHKLKLQTGLQYADMRDRAADGGAYTGWSWTTGFRISW